jgi:hypothetical protein
MRIARRNDEDPTKAQFRRGESGVAYVRVDVG